MDAVHRYEGTVNQVMGDGIMALFGAPLAHEDHAVRACYAALRMQELVMRYAEEARHAHGVNVQIRVGLNSGEVVVRSIGSDLHMDYTAVGQTTHLAGRMEQLASPGSILLTRSTLELVEGFVAVKALGPVPVKGLADPVEIYEMTGAGPARTPLPAQAPRRGLTRFVGRDPELEHLRRAQQLAGDGHGQVVAVVGEAGVGKSRLVHEFYETGLYPNPEYSFAHALTQDVTYGGLLQGRRQELHARIVEAIEALHGDRLGEHIERLAHHAGRAQLQDKAVDYLRQAGLKAAVYGAPGRPDLVRADPGRPRGAPGQPCHAGPGLRDPSFELRPVLAQLGEIRPALQRLREAEALAERLNDDRRRGQVCAFMTTAHNNLGELDEALVTGARAIEIAGRLGDLRLRLVTTTYS